MKVLAIASSKGGTGKTTLAVHLATGLAADGKRVLLVDMDPQGSATAWLMGGQTHTDQVVVPRGTFDVLRARSIAGEDLGRTRGLDFLASTLELRQADMLLAASPATGWSALRDALQAHTLAGTWAKDRWDFVVVDCPPNVSMGTMNALCAADGVVAPVLSGSLSLVGLGELELSVQQLRKNLRVKARILGYVLFAADPREAVTGELREELKRRGKLFAAEVRISTAAKTLSGAFATAWDAGVDERGREDYRAVLKEVLAKLKGGG